MIIIITIIIITIIIVVVIISIIISIIIIVCICMCNICIYIYILYIESPNLAKLMRRLEPCQLGISPWILPAGGALALGWHTSSASRDTKSNQEQWWRGKKPWLSINSGMPGSTGTGKPLKKKKKRNLFKRNCSAKDTHAFVPPWTTVKQCPNAWDPSGTLELFVCTMPVHAGNEQVHTSLWVLGIALRVGFRVGFLPQASWNHGPPIF